MFWRPTGSPSQSTEKTPPEDPHKEPKGNPNTPNAKITPLPNSIAGSLCVLLRVAVRAQAQKRCAQKIGKDVQIRPKKQSNKNIISAILPSRK